MTSQNERAGIPHLLDWSNAIAFIANHYRQSFSPGTLHAAAEWATQKTLPEALRHLARHAGLNCQFLSPGDEKMSAWRLPLVVQLRDGQVAVLESFDVNNAVGVRFVKELALLSYCPLETLLPEIEKTIAFRPSAPERDIRTESYLARFQPDWLRKIVLKDIRPYLHVMLASFAINVLALSGILFSMQVYDRVIPAQSYPTLYVLFSGVLLAAVFAFVLKIMRGHVTDLLGKRGDIRVSDRVFGHALRLKNSAVPRSTGSFISQIRELEQVREMMTSTMMTIVADLPFFLLFQVVLFIVSPWLSWIAPVATILMILPGLLLQRKLAALANKNQHENTLRNAILVESIQGLQDIKMMQAESRFLHQWNSYIAITAESGVKTRRLTHGLVSWGMSVQNLLYATVVVVGAPLVINGDITTGAMVAASMLSTRMVAPMTALCGVLARWQQVKTAKASLDNLMALPVEGGQDETRVHRAVLHGNYEFRQAEFRYGLNDAAIPLRINQLSIKAGERIAILGRIGAGKSTLLQAMMGNVELVSGELRLDDLSLPQIDLADIRRNATLLTQEARLFHGTLRENLILGRSAATDDEIFSVLTLCGALEFVRKLPLGLEHVIMEGGLGLSGGQRQSLLLARTLLRDPNIILLDEPTSFFDERTEKAFVEQLAQWAGERTMIIATHKAAVLNLPQIDLADIRRNATLLTQEARLFHGTLRENLILGRSAATDDEIFSVLTLCGALEFVRKLPLGLEHVIMEGGLGLSGGQRQSLLLARTLLRDPNIILLDEPTSFFDERTEKAFVEQLAQWAGERTMIIATHKAAVLNIVDRILVIQDGQLALDKPKATVFEQEKARGQVVNI